MRLDATALGTSDERQGKSSLWHWSDWSLLCLSLTAKQAYRCGEIAIAKACYEAILSFAPDQADALLQFGGILGQHGDLASAINLLRRGLAIKPNSIEG
jgi:tetratricopeptide (TPR) repeat protein